MNITPEVEDEATAVLYAGDRQWFDAGEHEFVRCTTLYLPYGNEKGGCPDWRGAWKGGDLTKMPCVFCGLPNAVKEYQNAFSDGAPVPHERIVAMFMHNITSAKRSGALHTLAVFNGGSFLSMEWALQKAILECVVSSGARRLVIESRAELVEDEAVAHIVAILAPHDIALTVRIGVETQDDKVRTHVLRKGHTRGNLMRAVGILHAYNITVGGYVLIAPAPHAWIQRVHPHVQHYEQWALDEAVATIDAVLTEFNMDEVYLCSTCVAPGTLLEQLWLQGEYEPASLSLVAEVLVQALATGQKKPIHLLPFQDEPAFVAVSSNHSRRGVHQHETMLNVHDVQFRSFLDFYRGAMDVRSLQRSYALLQDGVRDCSLCNLSV